jgi:hypothetical protein
MPQYKVYMEYAGGCFDGFSPALGRGRKRIRDDVLFAVQLCFLRKKAHAGYSQPLNSD